MKTFFLILTFLALNTFGQYEVPHELLPDKLESICHTEQCPFYGKREALFQGVKSVLDKKHRTIQGLSNLLDHVESHCRYPIENLDIL